MRSGQPAIATPPLPDTNHRGKSERCDDRSGDPPRLAEAPPIRIGHPVDRLDAVANDRVPPIPESDDGPVDEQQTQHTRQPGQEHTAFTEYLATGSFSGHGGDGHAHSRSKEPVVPRLLEGERDAGQRATGEQPPHAALADEVHAGSGDTQGDDTTGQQLTVGGEPFDSAAEDATATSNAEIPAATGPLRTWTV